MAKKKIESVNEERRRRRKYSAVKSASYRTATATKNFPNSAPTNEKLSPNMVKKIKIKREKKAKFRG